MRKILSKLALASFLASSLYAQQGANCDMKKDVQNSSMNQKDSKSCPMHDKQGMPSDMAKAQHGVLGFFKELNLTAEQKTKIHEFMNESKKDQEMPTDAFTKDSFDKEKYIKIMKEKREKSDELHANLIEKAYSVLDAKQKEQLRALLDAKKDKMK